jgi:formylglycine-generating enzyme required for sulfatase activity
MSGNVWEWTLSEYNSGDSNDITSAEPRVGRGGSWVHDRSRARSAARGFNINPEYLFDSGGFRVVGVVPFPLL